MRRAGWLVWLLVAAGLYFFENNAGTRAVLIASVFLPLLSGACALRAARRGVALTLEAPERVARGARAECRCRLAGGSALWRIGAVEARLVCENPLAGERAARPLRIANGEALFTAESAHCGTLRLRLEDACIRDWFGLWRVPVEARASAAVTVLPRLRPVRLEGLRERLLAQSAAPARGGGERADSEVRAYAPGDPVRRIHWKLSAKTDRLLVREDARPRETRLTLLLDTRAPRGREAAVSEAAEALLSVSAALLGEGITHGIAWVDQAAGESRRALVEDERGERAALEGLLAATASAEGKPVAEEGAEWALLFGAEPPSETPPGVRVVPTGAEDGPIAL